MTGGLGVPAEGQAVPAVLYAAKSSDDPRGSIPAQLDDCRAMAEHEGWIVVGDHQDEARSAYSGSRGPGLAAAKAQAAQLAAEHGQAALVVQHSDRLARGDGRSAAHLAQLFWWAFENGVRLRSVQDDSSLNDPLLATVMGMRNNEDSRRKSLATAAGLGRRAKAGHFHGGRPPFGYRYVRDRNDPRDNGNLVVEEAEAAIVRRIYDAYEAGHGSRRIARDLDADGVKPPSAAKWDPSTISNVLRQPAYTGQVHVNGETFDGLHAPIIDPERWEAAQRRREAIKERHAEVGSRYPTGRHLLVNGLLRCGACGTAMRGRTYHHRGDRAVYLCLTREQEKSCPTLPVERELVDAAVLRFFEDIGLDVEATRDGLASANRRQVAEAAALREGAERDLQRFEEQHVRIFRDYRDEKIGADDWALFRDAIASDVQATEAKLDRLRAREKEVEAEGALADATGEVWEYLSRVRAAISGQIADAEGVDAARAALTELFESFTLHTADADVVGPVWTDLKIGDLYLEPRLRPEAILRPFTVNGQPLGTPGAVGELSFEVRRVPLRKPTHGADAASALSAGSNALLRLGATPLTTTADVLESYGIVAEEKPDPVLGDIQRLVFGHVREAPRAADDLVRTTGLGAAAVAAILTELELIGLVTEEEGLYRVAG